MGPPVGKVIQEVDRCEHMLECKHGKDSDPRHKLAQLRVELLMRTGDVSTARKHWEDIIQHHQDEVDLIERVEIQLYFILNVKFFHIYR